MNTIGAILLVFSAAVTLFALCTALLALSLRSERNLSRLLSLECLDRLQKRRGRQRLSRRWGRYLLSRWRPLKHLWLQGLGLPSPVSAVRLSGLAIHTNFAVVSLALLTLTLLMLIGDLSNRYVVSHSSQDLPFFFRITAVWAGSSGSLLLWYWMLCFFSSVVVRQARKIPVNQAAVLFLILASTQIIFVSLSLFFRDAQPFRTYALEMQAGSGINPLLLHWAMILHPPILYIGYVSSAIPFAILFSAVISGNTQRSLFPFLRRWCLFSWFFLGTGILLGSKWAYEELGWGGYWAWDPVENASLMPWLVLTAFLHSLMVQERRAMLRFWNVVLILTAYHLCLLGTWITRSGILEGPHTFAESSIGLPLVFFIALSILYFSRFLYFARYTLRSRRSMEALTSKEGSMLFNNFFMLLAMLIIFLGVFSPLLPLECSFGEKGLDCYRVEWKQGAYNRILIPLGLFTLFLMGASPLLSWRKGAAGTWYKLFRKPFIAGIAGGIIFSVFYGRLFTRTAGPDTGTWGSGLISEIMAILTVGIATFVITGIGQEYFDGIRHRRRRLKESITMAFLRLLLANRRRYGGYLVHLSIVFLFIGYSGSAFKKTTKLEFHYYKLPWHPQSEVVHYYSGDIAYIENYEIQAKNLFFRPVFQTQADPQNPIYFTISQEAHYHVQSGIGSRGPQNIDMDARAYARANRPQGIWASYVKFISGYVLDGRMRTERRFYPRIDPVSGQVLRNPQKHAVHIPTSEPDIRSTWNEDIYIQLGALSVPQAKQNVSLNHFYEAYYHLFKKDERAYAELFPPQLLATLEVWINPMVKFIWLGSLLFFLAGLLLLLPRRKSEF